MKQAVSDAELVGRVLAGESEAYSVLVERYTNVLSSIAYLRVRNAEDVRDIVQEAFVTGYCKLDQLDSHEHFGAWIRAIAINCSRRVLEKRTRTQRLLERLPRPTEMRDPLREVGLREKGRQTLQALGALSELHREVVLLYYFHDLKVDGVARLIDRPSGTIKRILAEARGKLREELVDMAREGFPEYQLTEEQRRRLDMIPVFPREEPKISTKRLPDDASAVTAVAPQGNFPALRVGSEVSYADYDYPGRKMKMITHVKVEGPFDVKGKQTLRYDNLDFDPDSKLEWIWRPYYCIEDGDILYCAKQHGSDPDLPLITPDQPDWNEPQPQPMSTEMVPGSMKEPSGDQSGYIVEGCLWEVRIGRRSFRCLKRLTGGDKRAEEWSDEPVSNTAVEEYFLDDGRMLLWRRYNGERWSERNPARQSDAPGTYERLAEAGAPSLEVFGEKYYLWYDQIPDYALR